jgi:hypothetical protein
LQRNLLIPIQDTTQTPSIEDAKVSLRASDIDVKTAFDIYESLVIKTKPDAEIFQLLMEISRKSGQYNRLKKIWKEMQRYSVIPTQQSFHWLLSFSAKSGDSVLGRQLLQLMKGGNLPFSLNVVDCTQLFQAFSR